MRYRHILSLVVALSGAGMAQTGLQGGTDGMRQTSARTLGQANWLFGIGAEAASGYSLLPEGYTTNGEHKAVDSYRPATVSTYVNFGVGLMSFWDLSASMPFYYDHLKPSEGDNTYAMRDAWSAGQGDLQIQTKLRLPLAEDYPFQAAVLGLFSTPTGHKDKGFYPRHLSYIGKNGTATHPFTSTGIVAGGGLALSLDLSSQGIPLHFNGYGSYEHPWEGGLDDVISWALGINQKSWEFVTTFAEVSGSHRKNELRREKSPMADHLLASAGMRLHLPSQWDLGLAVDVSPSDKGNVSVTQTSNSETTRYTTGNPDFGVSALLVYNSGRRSFDTDKDGVPDSRDRCPGTPAQVQVDERGCPTDQDRDGVPDYLDKCPGTLEGIPVQADGCPSDTDNDGIPDFQDKCPNTPAGVPVDAQGCVRDSDQDGVPDHQDKCPNTPAGVPVDSLGCPSDMDGDGVPDQLDKCPGTPAEIAVDSAGCPRDSDGDGVPDHLDQCPGTAAGLAVDPNGCPSDADGDGVRNEFDLCPNTPAGLMVNQHGCPADTDQDGVADYLDKCPGTPEGVAVDTLGCPLDSDGDGVPDYLDKCPRTLKGVEINASGCPLRKEQDLTQLQRAINFKTGSAELTRSSYPTLDLVVALLKAIPTAKLEIQGHTDNTGSEEKNTQLSQERAVAVGTYFTNNGIDKSRLRPKGYGSSTPVQSNATAVGRTANRRVELVPYD